MRTRAEWHLNSCPMTHDVHELVWNLEIDCMSVWCLCVVTEGICVVIIWCSWLSKGAPHKSLCKSILVISAKASSYHLFMREWTSVSHNPRVLFSSLALFYEEVSGLIPPTTLLFLCPVRSFFAALGAVNPWLQFPLNGGVRSGDYFKAGSHAPAPAHMAALKARRLRGPLWTRSAPAPQKSLPLVLYMLKSFWPLFSCQTPQHFKWFIHSESDDQLISP